jgi:hypothetical protein
VVRSALRSVLEFSELYILVNLSYPLGRARHYVDAL